MATNYLLDTNAILYILKIRMDQKISKNCHILELTFYEYGNAILNLMLKRKNEALLSYENATILLQAFEKIASHATIVDMETSSMDKILQIAIKDNLTYYDASFLQYCSQYDCVLVTEDERLSAAASNNSIKVMDSGTWINRSSSR